MRLDGTMLSTGSLSLRLLPKTEVILILLLALPSMPHLTDSPFIVAKLLGTRLILSSPLFLKLCTRVPRVLNTPTMLLPTEVDQISFDDALDQINDIL